MKNSKIRKKLYAEQSEAKIIQKIKEGRKKLNFGASKNGVGGAGPPLPLTPTPPRIRTWSPEVSNMEKQQFSYSD